MILELMRVIMKIIRYNLVFNLFFLLLRVCCTGLASDASSEDFRKGRRRKVRKTGGDWIGRDAQPSAARVRPQVGTPCSPALSRRQMRSRSSRRVASNFLIF